MDDDLVEVQAGLTADDRVVRDRDRRRAGEEVKPRPVTDRRPSPAGSGSARRRPAPARRLPRHRPGPGRDRHLPGGERQVVEDTVAGPIGQQLNGLEKVTHHVLACATTGPCA